jgi:hypothetical protein
MLDIKTSNVVITYSYEEFSCEVAVQVKSSGGKGFYLMDSALDRHFLELDERSEPELVMTDAGGNSLRLTIDEVADLYDICTAIRIEPLAKAQQTKPSSSIHQDDLIEDVIAFVNARPKGTHFIFTRFVKTQDLLRQRIDPEIKLHLSSLARLLGVFPESDTTECYVSCTTTIYNSHVYQQLVSRAQRYPVAGMFVRTHPWIS